MQQKQVAWKNLSMALTAGWERDRVSPHFPHTSDGEGGREGGGEKEGKKERDGGRMRICYITNVQSQEESPGNPAVLLCYSMALLAYCLAGIA